MFIFITYRDVPELSSHSILHMASETSTGSELKDMSIEKTLLVNPQCPVRVMLEYIRKQCKLGSFTQFDLCDESGFLMSLFDMPTYEYATHMFEHKRVYYIVVFKQENGKTNTYFPQVNHENRLFEELKFKIERNLNSPTPHIEDKVTPLKTSAKSTPLKSTPSKIIAPSKKK